VSDPLSPKSIIPAEVVECLICKAENETARRHDPDGDEAPALLQIGRTPLGLQVWCLRHDTNVYHVEFGKHDLSVLRMFEAQIGGSAADA
jgi:hypothetical protein